jgi:hypothetical protein
MAEKVKFEDIKSMLTEKGFEVSDLLSMARIRPPQDPFSVYDLNGDGGDQDAIIFAVKKGIKGRIFGMLESKIKGYRSTDGLDPMSLGDTIIDPDGIKSDEKEVTTAASITLPVVKLSYKKKTAKQDARAGIKKYVDSLSANVILTEMRKDEWALVDKTPVEKEKPSETPTSETEKPDSFIPMKLRPDPDYIPEKNTIQGEIYFTNNPTPPEEKDILPYEISLETGKWTLMEIDQQVYLLEKKKMELDESIIKSMEEFYNFKKEPSKWKKIGNLNYYAYEGRENYPEKYDPDALTILEKYKISIKGEYSMMSNDEKTKVKVTDPYGKYVIFPGDEKGFMDNRTFYVGKKVDLGDLLIIKKVEDAMVKDIFRLEFDYPEIEEPEEIDEEYAEELFDPTWSDIYKNLTPIQIESSMVLRKEILLLDEKSPNTVGSPGSSPGSGTSLNNSGPAVVVNSAPTPKSTAKNDYKSSTYWHYEKLVVQGWFGGPGTRTRYSSGVIDWDAMHSFSTRGSDGFGGRMTGVLGGVYGLVSDALKKFYREKKLNPYVSKIKITVDEAEAKVTWKAVIDESPDGKAYVGFNSWGGAGGTKSAPSGHAWTNYDTEWNTINNAHKNTIIAPVIDFWYPGGFRQLFMQFTVPKSFPYKKKSPKLETKKVGVRFNQYNPPKLNGTDWFTTRE